MDLVVTHPFGEYAYGARITDPEIVKRVLENNPTHVIKVASPEKPPAPPPPPPPAAPPAPAPHPEPAPAKPAG